MLTINEEAIRVQMAKLNMNRQEVAAAAGISANTLYLAMAGGNIKLSTLYDIAHVLKLDPRELLIVSPNGHTQPEAVPA
jgi:DNA-binding Xre family transcriptional regulator